MSQIPKESIAECEILTPAAKAKRQKQKTATDDEPPL